MRIDPFAAFHPIRRHADSPACSHLKPLINDVVSVLEDMQNYYVQILETNMSALADKLIAGVHALTQTVIDHDAVIQEALAKLGEARASGDDEAIQKAIDEIAAASTTLAADTTKVQTALTNDHADDAGTKAAEASAPSTDPAADAAAEATKTDPAV